MSASNKIILSAFERHIDIAVANGKKMKVIALTGIRGADLKDRVDVAIIVPIEETARIQEVHEIVFHVWCEYIDTMG